MERQASASRARWRVKTPSSRVSFESRRRPTSRARSSSHGWRRSVRGTRSFKSRFVPGQRRADLTRDEADLALRFPGPRSRRARRSDVARRDPVAADSLRSQSASTRAASTSRAPAARRTPTPSAATTSSFRMKMRPTFPAARGSSASARSGALRSESTSRAPRRPSPRASASARSSRSSRTSSRPRPRHAARRGRSPRSSRILMPSHSRPRRRVRVVWDYLVDVTTTGPEATPADAPRGCRPRKTG